MNKEEIQKILDELYAVRPEMLNDKAKRLFEAIMQIADERDKAYKIIDKMAEDIEEHMSEEVHNFLYICDKCKSNNEECHGDYCTETIKEYFKKVVDEDE